ncbi:hypothetical protein EZ428_02350 [Pedobacter frigiditerrae]|uniref:Uncharacterized protein n=1 Tax=Pedobacter frigiditerrae TaxID=2530452 RepID=A0A4R0N1I5_9SPHI|nr:hypothetical protein [Pedobacter frigiditerrae]TCC93631.1 hypothetical protein EZ428_02350 [Pedobacter frigiditerrae]
MKFKSVLVFGIFVLASLFYSQKSLGQDVVIKWSPSMDKYVLGYYTLMAKEIGLSSSEVTSISNCMLAKLKAQFPNGLSTSKEKFGDINKKIAGECLPNIKGVVPWNLSNEKYVKDRLLNDLPKNISEETKAFITACAFSRYKAKYPNGISVSTQNIEEQKSDFLSMINICVAEANYMGIPSWSEKNISLFKLFLLEQLPKDMAGAKKDKYMICFIQKLKNKYPNGFSIDNKNRLEFESLFKNLDETCITESNKG